MDELFTKKINNMHFENRCEFSFHTEQDFCFASSTAAANEECHIIYTKAVHAKNLLKIKNQGSIS